MIVGSPHRPRGSARSPLAAALANEELGLLEPRKAAVVEACREIRGGKLHDQFVVDVIQGGGAGTSTSVNANEVIANRVSKHPVLALQRSVRHALASVTP